MFLQEACFFQGVVRTVLVDCTQGFHRDFHTNELAQFGNPDAFFLKIRITGTIDSLGHVATDTALFLGETGAVNATAGVRDRASDDADTGHGNQVLMVTGEEG